MNHIGNFLFSEYEIVFDNCCLLLLNGDKRNHSNDYIKEKNTLCTKKPV